MTAAEVSSWHTIFVGVGVVWLSNVLLGFIRPGERNGPIAFVQACTYTIFAMLPELAVDKPDGQAGMSIPIFLLLFFAASWVGLAVGDWAAGLAKSRR